MLGKIELFGYFLLDGVVFEVAIKFRQSPESYYLQCFPNRRHVGVGILLVMLKYKLFLSPFQFFLYMGLALLKNRFVAE